MGIEPRGERGSATNPAKPTIMLAFCESRIPNRIATLLIALALNRLKTSELDALDERAADLSRSNRCIFVPPAGSPARVSAFATSFVGNMFNKSPSETR